MGTTYNVNVEFRKVESNNTKYPYRVGFTVPNEVNFTKVEDTVNNSYCKHGSTFFPKTHEEWFDVKTIDACHDLFMKVEKVLMSQSNTNLEVKLAKPESTLFSEAQKALMQPNRKDAH